ncbi:MAG TPA: hypothetical protein DCR23_06375 [Ruminococcaceae bacterium]|nr:hypothetical protein [Oscillospiraceae bacterium]
MTKTRKNEAKTGESILNSLLYCVISAVIGYGLFLILSLLLNVLSINNADLFYKSNYILYIILAVSALISGIIATKVSKLKAIISGSLNGLFLSILIVLQLSLFGKIAVSIRLLILVLIIIISSTVSAIIFKNFKR